MRETVGGFQCTTRGRTGDQNSATGSHGVQGRSYDDFEILYGYFEDWILVWTVKSKGGGNQGGPFKLWS